MNCVIFHSPGKNWSPGASFQKQPGIDLHVTYYAHQLEQGRLFAGGPFLDDSGGMMILAEGITEAEARVIAEFDPCVASGLLTYKVMPWRAVIKSGNAQDDD